MINEKVLSIYNKKTKSIDVTAGISVKKFDLGGGTKKIAGVNIRSIQAAPEDESDTVEEQSVTVVEEQVPPNSTVDNGVDTDVIAVAEDDATPVVIGASSTVNTVLDNAQSLLGRMNITDDNNEGKNTV